MMDIKQVLINRGTDCDIAISHEQAEKLQKYMELLIDWNEKVNLTAITQPLEVAEKHFIDSMMVLKYVDLSDKSIIDVGTGAGFPGLVLKIMCPSLKVTLLDSLNKRLVFLNDVIEKLELTEVYTVHGRAEDMGRNKDYREKFDYSISRAVARLNVLSEYCIPFVKQGGSFLAMKGPAVKEELNIAENAISLLGGKCNASHSYSLLGGDERVILQIDKVEKTEARFPRTSKAMARKELL